MQLGIDEVGRGCLAGPLVVGVVGLSNNIEGLKDSKLLSKTKRQQLAKLIYAQAEAATLGWVWPHELDELGLTRAMTLAINRALSQIDTPISSIIIDGNYNYLKDNDLATTLINADALVPAVSAASIIAKVARDNYMAAISDYFPDYDFASHVGYGTKQHLLAIENNGPCVLHRMTFRPLSKIAANSF
jgi:ribonuclease HII